jgi:hypothetical protein
MKREGRIVTFPTSFGYVSFKTKGDKMKEKERKAYRRGWQDCEEAMLNNSLEERRNELDHMFIEARKECKIKL